MDTLVITPATSAIAETGQLVTLSLALIGAAIVLGVIIGNRRKNAARRAQR